MSGEPVDLLTALQAKIDAVLAEQCERRRRWGYLAVDRMGAPLSTVERDGRADAEYHALGDEGRVLVFSDDDGKTWEQA